MSYEKHCFICGTDNEKGLKLIYNYNEKDDFTYVDFCPEKHHQSYDGVFHGGLQTAIMDSAMVHALKIKDINAVTARMDIRFREPVENETPVRIEASFSPLESKKGFYKATSKIYQNSRLKTECSAIFRKLEE